MDFIKELKLDQPGGEPDPLPWPVLCPKCKGKPIRHIRIGHCVPFPSTIEGFCFAHGKAVICCLNCQGKGTIIHD